MEKYNKNTTHDKTHNGIDAEYEGTIHKNLDNLNEDISKGLKMGADYIYKGTDLIQGIVAASAGTILFVYASFGWLTYIITPVIALSGAALVFWGGLRANVYERIKDLGKYFRPGKK